MLEGNQNLGEVIHSYFTSIWIVSKPKDENLTVPLWPTPYRYSTPDPQGQSLEGNEHSLLYTDLAVPAAFLPWDFCVQRMVGVKIRVIKSQVSPCDLDPGSEPLQTTRGIPRRGETPRGGRLRAELVSHVERVRFLPLGINTRCLLACLLGRHEFASACSLCSGRARALKACQFLMEICS